MTLIDPHEDIIQPFRVDALDGLGRLVRLGPAAHDILSRHDYPHAVSVLLGEALALTAALAGSLKFEGTFTTQMQGDGPLHLMVVDYRTDGSLRGYAGFDRARLAEDETCPPPAPGDTRLFGRGHMAFTIDQGPETERYQALVALEGDSLAASAHGFLARSEQLRSSVHAAAVRCPGEDGGADHWRAGSLIMQQMPRSDGRTESEDDVRSERWAETQRLLTRLRRVDLADPLAFPRLLIGPLFAGHDVRLHPARDLHFACRCTAARAGAVVNAIPRQERLALADDGRIEVRCDFCNTPYSFDLDGAPIVET